jgi:hypothetical protein
MATGRIGTTPVLQVRWSKAPSAGTTSLSGLDDNSVSLVYSVGYEAVYRNGVLLSRTNDYTATDGTTVTLIDATIAGDIIEIFANQTIPLADTYSQTVANGKFINNTLTTTTGDIIYASAANTPARLAIGSTDQVLKVSGGIPAWGAAPSPSFVGAIAYGAVNLSYNNTATAISNLTTEIVDTDNFHSTSTNTSRMTIPSGKDGKYLMQLDINLAATGASSPNIYLRAYKNGSAITEGLTNGNLASFLSSQQQDGHFNVSLVVTGVATDYFEFFIIMGGGSSTIDKARYSFTYLGA